MIAAIDAECRNWALWMRGVGERWPAPRRVRSSWGPMILDPNMGAGGDGRDVLPKVDAAAADALFKRIRKLEARLRRTLREHYLRGGTKEQKAKRVGCAPATFYVWLDEAHRALQAQQPGRRAGLAPS